MNRPVPIRDGILIATAALVLYCLFGQQTLYKGDGQVFLWKSHFRVADHNYHIFYGPILEGLKWLLAPLDLTIYESARLYSALGTAIGVWFAHVACRRLGLSRGDCAWASGWIALCPAIFFFATVVEAHGPFFAVAGAAMFASARLVTAPTAANSILAGLSVGVLYLSHPTGALMLALFPALFVVADEDAQFGRCVRPTLIAGATAVLWIAAVPMLLRSAGAMADSGFQLAFLREYGLRVVEDSLNTLEVATWEWLVPFLPMSVAWLWALATRRWRRAAVALAAGLLPYLALCQIFLKSYDEGGAYLLPVAWPAALLTLRVLHKSLAARVLALVVAAVVGIVRVNMHDEPARARSYFDGVRAIADGKAFAVGLGDWRDLEAFFLYFQDALAMELYVIAAQGDDGFAKTVAFLDIRARAHLAAGNVLLLSGAARRNLRHAAESGQWPLSDEPPIALPCVNAKRLLDHFERQYTFEAVSHSGFSGFRMRLR